MWAMFPLSCAHVSVHTGRETSAHIKTRSAQQNIPSKKFFAHILCTSSHIQTSPGKCCTKEILCTHRV